MLPGMLCRLQGAGLDLLGFAHASATVISLILCTMLQRAGYACFGRHSLHCMCQHVCQELDNPMCSSLQPTRVMQRLVKGLYAALAACQALETHCSRSCLQVVHKTLQLDMHVALRMQPNGFDILLWPSFQIQKPARPTRSSRTYLASKEESSTRTHQKPK